MNNSFCCNFFLDDYVGGEGLPPGPAQGVQLYIGNGRAFRPAKRHEVLRQKEEESHWEKKHLFTTGHSFDAVRNFFI